MLRTHGLDKCIYASKSSTQSGSLKCVEWSRTTLVTGAEGDFQQPAVNCVGADFLECRISHARLASFFLEETPMPPKALPAASP